jgi:23S rRNA pseudouridine2605 synthase
MSRQSRRPPSGSKSVPGAAADQRGQRLQKVLAAAGIASRRECESLILAGRVEIDRRTVTELGTRVDPDQQEIRVDGVPLAPSRHVYYAVNKPAGVVSTNRDPDGRTRVVDLVPGETRLFTVGRLDRSSEGLIIVTNDGELANLLTHPRYGIPKTYRVWVQGFPPPETLQKLREGVHLAEGVARVSELRARGRHARGAELEMVLTEGRNREIRRILARVEHKVLQLRRVAIGPLRLGNLAPGEIRRLTGAEVQQLRQCVRRLMKNEKTPGASTSVPLDKKRQRTETGRPARRPSTGRTPVAGKGQTGGKPRRPQRPAAGRPARPPQAPTRRPKPKLGAVLDYDQPSGSGTARPAKKHSSGKKRRP